MSRGDVALRALEREAQGGDQGAEVRLLVARLRAGTLTIERVELAAYCGSEVAQEVLDPGVRFATPDGRSLTGALDFQAWLDHLSRRWADVGPVPDWVLVRAAVAAARVAAARAAMCPGWEGSWTASPNGACGCGHSYDAHVNRDKNPRLERALLAIEAVEAWLAAESTPERVRAVERAERRCGDAGPRMRFVSSLIHVLGPSIGVDYYFLDAVQDSAERAGEAPVRSAICSALTSWALETPA